MTVRTLGLSHSPLMGRNTPDGDDEAAVAELFRTLRDDLAAYDPELIVCIGPDHYNGFTHGLMPPFCIGTAAETVGDWDTSTGPVNVPTSTADGLIEHVLDQGIDVAFSRDMRLDHGFTQPLDLLGLRDHPVVPVFVNGVARPFGPIARARALGTAIGHHLRDDDRRILLLGSGGLSHDPPVPDLDDAPPAVRDRLIGRTTPTREESRTREQAVADHARAFAAGDSPRIDLNPGWDNRFLDTLADGRLADLDALTPADMAHQAGYSVHEVRTWIIAFAAQAAAGPYTTTHRFYRPIPQWFAGFAALAAQPRSHHA